ncbi:ABC transporter permease [Amycolatopsis sp. H20-H5]|uniref:ABC transporter permease n=1 Tax=Amycolatopsis sp. H20-H5 TaxID=3046309 RepID=UPI002DBB8340|nr:ABC transporter permease [Amycolatopsis sp. H20-H5]MEC3976312.1 ABC transporter permease [Amycolatopsis sp. H20-H5]
MYWLTYRQHRVQFVVTVAFLVVLGAVLLASASATAGADEEFMSLYPYLSSMPVLPIAVGVFWGAPLLAAEYERGTSRLAWTQSISRGRWLASKLGALGLLVTLAGLGFGLMIQAWLNAFPAVRTADRFGDMSFFAMTGVAPGAWWLFGFMLGTAAGAVIRKTLPAIAVTIAVFVLVLIGIFTNRGGYAEPVVVPADTAAGVPAGMILRPATLDGGTRAAYEMQPSDRYWRFQWTEAGILLTGTLLLTAGTVVAVRRRL